MGVHIQSAPIPVQRRLHGLLQSTNAMHSKCNANCLRGHTAVRGVMASSGLEHSPCSVIRSGKQNRTSADGQGKTLRNLYAQMAHTNTTPSRILQMAGNNAHLEAVFGDAKQIPSLNTEAGECLEDTKRYDSRESTGAYETCNCRPYLLPLVDRRFMLWHIRESVRMLHVEKSQPREPHHTTKSTVLALCHIMTRPHTGFTRATLQNAATRIGAASETLMRLIALHSKGNKTHHTDEYRMHLLRYVKHAEESAIAPPHTLKGWLKTLCGAPTTALFKDMWYLSNIALVELYLRTLSNPKTRPEANELAYCALHMLLYFLSEHLSLHLPVGGTLHADMLAGAYPPTEMAETLRCTPPTSRESNIVKEICSHLANKQYNVLKTDLLRFFTTYGCTPL
ncbi:ORF99 [Ranid herpesvirus 1]|uniref:ORF99 n=1 Tax=Ranid herpesvirus 1 TaxID=85655 RepID=Q14VN1_9VIRU|nr:ORF99 [Ranid herpesvirus 1]ABG25742.1 ORF99 [Ranid herpesvirus 1]